MSLSSAPDDWPSASSPPSRPEAAAFWHAPHAQDTDTAPRGAAAEASPYPNGPSGPPPPPSAPITQGRFTAAAPVLRRVPNWSLGILAGLISMALLVIILLLVANTGLIAQNAPVAVSVTATPSPLGTSSLATATVRAATATPAGSVPPLPTATLGSGAQPTASVPPPATATVPVIVPTLPAPTATALPATATSAPMLHIALTCLAVIDKHTAQICVTTQAGAALAIQVEDCDGVVDAKAPTAGTADAAGHFTATWKPRKPHGDCTTAKVDVVAAAGGQAAEAFGTLNLAGSE
jgi:hypothetical protein